MREMQELIDTNMVSSWFVYNAPTSPVGFGFFDSLTDHSLANGIEHLVDNPPVYHSPYSSGMYDFRASRGAPVSSEIRPINKAVRYIKYTNAPVLPNIPDPPISKIYYRYIAKVRY